MDGFSARRRAGEEETHRVGVRRADFSRNLYYALVAVDNFGNAALASNVRRAYMPNPEEVDFSSKATSFPSSPSGRGGAVPTQRKEKVLLFIVAGIVGFLVLCVVLVLCIVVSYRRKKHVPDSANSSNDNSANEGSEACNSDAMRSMGVSVGGSNHHLQLQSPGYSVCDENDVTKEQLETNRFLAAAGLVSSSTYSDAIQQQQQQNSVAGGSVSFADDNSSGNVYSNSYGWTELNNPYVVQSPNGSTSNNNGISLPTYRDFQSQQNGYVPNYYNQPTYARPLPKSQRINNGSSLYSNTLQHSTPQSQNSGGSSTLSSHHTNGSGSGSGGILYRQNLANTLLTSQQQQQQQQHSGSLSGDERVPSISPPIDGGVGGTNSEQIRLISSLSNTPTKSILKKPKNGYGTPSTAAAATDLGVAPLVRQEDQSSQSSSSATGGTTGSTSGAAGIRVGGGGGGGGGGEQERLSESSNVSFSDRETPTEGAVVAAGASQSKRSSQEVEGAPDYSPSNTYLETSFECQQGGAKVPPPTLPKPKAATATEAAEEVGSNNTLDKKIRNITQV